MQKVNHYGMAIALGLSLSVHTAVLWWHLHSPRVQAPLLSGQQAVSIKLETEDIDETDPFNDTFELPANRVTTTADDAPRQLSTLFDEEDLLEAITKPAPREQLLETEQSAVENDIRLTKPPVPPAYPQQARRLGQEGTVMLAVQIEPSGHVTDIQLASSSSFVLLDEAAIEAVAQWEFAAFAQTDTHSIWVHIPIEFSLRS